MNKIIIIGSGPAGYTAAIYAARANHSPILIEGPQLGGQLTTTTEVENFPGYPEGVEPYQMMDDLRRQAERFGTKFISGVVTKVELGNPHIVTVEDTDIYETQALIIATGASAKYLGLPSEETYRGRGVSACATCDGEAQYLAGLCEKVYLIVRKPYLRASQIMQQRVLDNPKIEVLFEHNTLQLTGEGKVQGADLIYRKGEADETLRHIDIDGFFLAIGHHPNTQLFANSLARNEEGYLLTDGVSQQCLTIDKQIAHGVFAAGDCCDSHYRQAIVAAGTGSKAAIDADKYLKTL